MKGKYMSYIQLKHTPILTQGSHHEYYRHPESHGKCIRIATDHDGQRSSNREMTFIQLMRGRDRSTKTLPRFYGLIRTDLGLGYVYDFIENYDGTPAPTLADILSDERMLLEHVGIEKLKNLLTFLHEDIIENQIISTKMTPRKILFPKSSDSIIHIYLTEPLGSSALIPLEYISNYFALRKIHSKWEKLKEEALSCAEYDIVKDLIKVM